MHNRFYPFTSSHVLVSLCLGSLGLGSTAYGQRSVPDSTRELAPVVVTAPRYATRQALVPQKIDVITPQDIALTPANDLTDVIAPSCKTESTWEGR